MQQEGTLGILSKHRHELKGFGVKSIALFGSAARGEAQHESDIDILKGVGRESAGGEAPF